MIRVSVYGPSRRVNEWVGIYNMLSTPGVDLELVFAGPVVCDTPLPSNIKVITTQVKPAQAAEIARRACTGDYIMNIADDCIFPKDILNTFISIYKNLPAEDVMLTALFGFRGNYTVATHRLNCGDVQSPVVPVSGFLSMELSNRIGGIDKNFVALYWDLDLAMRLYQLGGRVQLETNILFYEDESKQANSSLFNTYGSSDRLYFNMLWGDGKSHTRTLPVQEFDDKDILLYSQGNKGNFTI